MNPLPAPQAAPPDGGAPPNPSSPPITPRTETPDEKCARISTVVISSVLIALAMSGSAVLGKQLVQNAVRAIKSTPPHDLVPVAWHSLSTFSSSISRTPVQLISIPPGVATSTRLLDQKGGYKAMLQALHQNNSGEWLLWQGPGATGTEALLKVARIVSKATRFIGIANPQGTFNPTVFLVRNTHESAAIVRKLAKLSFNEAMLHKDIRKRVVLVELADTVPTDGHQDCLGC